MKLFLCLTMSVTLIGLTACTTGGSGVAFRMTPIKSKPGFCIIRTATGEVFEADCQNNKLIKEFRKKFPGGGTAQ